jgi:Ras-related protein Rab-8A
MNTDVKTDYSLKVLTIGESAVGKTCLLMRFTDNKFLKVHLTTIGIDYKTKFFKTTSGYSVRLKVWDTAGQERFRTVTQQYYKGADGILLVYDITDRGTFDKVKDWVKQIQANTTKENVQLILVGNKCDLEERQVSTEEGVELAKEFGVQFFETSAYKDINVNEAFETLTNEIIKRKEPDTKLSKDNEKVIVSDTKKPNKKDSKCC